MDIKSDIHAALEAVTPPAPHLADVVMDAVQRGERPRPAPRGRRAAMGALGVLLLLATGIGVIGFRTSQGVPAPAGSGAPVQPMSWSGTLNAGQSSRPLALQVRFGQEVALITHLPSYPDAHMQVLLYDPAGRLSQTVDSSNLAPTQPWRPAPGTWSVVVRDLASPPGAAWRLDATFRRAPLVVTTWEKDPSVTAGPYPGYRPHVSSLDRGLIASARPVRDPNAPLATWAVEGRWTAYGSTVFRDLTTAAAHSCPQHSCPESHVTAWVGLTQDDIDHWNERASTAYQPAWHGGDLVTDPAVLHPITGGTWLLTGGYSQQDARDIASWLAPAGRP